MHDSDCVGKAFTLSLLVILQHVKDLYAILIGCIGFFHVKIERIDLYKWALWNEILVLFVIKSKTTLCL